MSYSLRGSEFSPKKQGDQYNYFTEEQWSAYPFADEESTKWFREARYGLFLHVGISAMGMVDISWSRNTHKLPDPLFWGGGVSDEEYDSWATKIAFSRFNAKEWAGLARDGGFRYVVIIAKHHDGFHMWDTAYSEYKITNSPFARDYLRELVSAMRQEGLRIGIYYSQRDWVHPDYEPVPVEDAVRTEEAPYFKMMNGKSWYLTERQKRYQEYMFQTVRELMTDFGKIDLLWWDAECNSGMFTKETWNTEEIERMVRSLQPHIMINNRGGLPGDFDTPEDYVGFFQNTRMWETCMPLGKYWAYSENGIKSKTEIIDCLVNCAGGDGNYLLSIGCKPDGSIAEDEARRIREIGDWLKEYGESIYGTRGGIWKPAGDYASTFQGNTVYLHILKNIPADFSLPLRKNSVISCEAITGEKVGYEVHGGRIYLTVAHRKEDAVDTIIRIGLDNAPAMEE